MKLRSLIVITIGAALLASVAHATELRLSHQWSTRDVRHKVAEIIANHVKDANVDLEIKIFHSKSLFKPREQYKLLSRGQLDMTVLPLPYAGGRQPSYNLTLMPGLVKNHDHAARLNYSPFMDAVQEKMAEDDVMVLVHGYFGGGLVGKDKCLSKPSDVKGLQMRAAGKSFNQLLAGAGASIASMASSEIYNALQTGVLDGANTSSASLVGYRIYEQVRCYTPAFWYMYQPLLMNKSTFEGLNAAQQKALRDGSKKAEEYYLAEAKEQDANAVKVFKAAGVQIKEMSKDDFQAWQDLAKKTSYKQFVFGYPEGRRFLQLALAVEGDAPKQLKQTGVLRKQPQIAQVEPKLAEPTNQPNADDSERVKALEKRLALIESERLKDKQALAALEAQTKQSEQAIASDTQPPSLRILGKYAEDESGVFEGSVTDNVEVAELRVNGRPIGFDSSGRFTHKEYLPSGGSEFTIVAIDRAGLKTTETIRINREAPTRVAKISFDNLNPTTRRVESNNDAIALIVGVAQYKETAGAEYADRDAQVFYDYAHLKLGIPRERIQTLINDKADVVGLLSGINKWLKRSVKQGESDVYIFFAGHGLASDDGDTAYLIPYDGAPDFLERTAISRDEVFREVSSVNPRSVTVFLDTCYSGDTRGESRLIAGRPLGIRLQEQSLPVGFTVLTAAGGDQIAKPLKEAQHGMFSYFLMKGMEGGADSNSDNQITARELHTYVRENVVQQSGGSQVPELQGDGEKVLVRFR